MKSLRIKISVILTAVIVLLLIGVSLISYNIARNLYTEKVVKDELPLAVSNVAGEIGYAIDKIINTSYQMTKNDYLLKWIDEGEPKDGLATLFNYNTDLMKAFNLSTAMFVSDKTLNYYTNDKILKQLSKDNPRDSWYFDVKNGKEVTEHLGSDHSIFMCIESLFKEEPTTLQIEALEPSFVYALPKADLERIALHNVNIQMMYRKILEESLIISQVHADLVRFESAKNRYQKMQKLYPQVILRAPLTYVANYLQMTPETLSRVRASLLFD